MENTESITKTKRPKYGGRKSLSSDSPTVIKRVTQHEYELIKVLRAKNLTEQCLDFAMSN